MRSLSFVSAAVFAVILSACSSGGITLPPNQMCTDAVAANSPISMKPLPKTEMSLDAKVNAEAQLMKPGKYTYTSSVIYFKENRDIEPVIVEFQDAATAGVSTKQTGVCMRGARAGVNGIVAESAGVSDIRIFSDYTQMVYTRDFKFSITGNTKIAYKVGPISDTTADQASDVYEKMSGPAKLTDVKMVKNTATDFEVRAQMLAPTGVFYISTHMAYSPCVWNDKTQIQKCN